jgi:integrase
VPGKRGNHEGLIRQRKDDGRWEARLTIAPGKTKSLYGKTQADALAALRKLQRERDQGLLGSRDDSQALGTYLARWLEMVKAQVRDSGYLSYEERIRLYITPRLGRVKLSKLTPQHVRELHAWMLNEKKLSPTTVNHTHGVLHHALKDAIRMGVIARNVCEAVDPPRKAKRKMVIYTPEQVRALLEAARGSDYEALITVAITTGARLGELLALRQSACDLDHATITIAAGRAEVAGGWADTEPKTDAGNRTIALTAATAALLREHRKRWLEQRLWLGDAWQGDKDGYVFPNQVGAS